MIRSTRLLVLLAAAAVSSGCGAMFGSATGPGGSAGLEEGLRDAKREVLRRSTEKPEFHRAFEVVFLGRPPFDPSPKAEEALRQRLAAQPGDAALALKLADIYISRSEWAKAEPLVKQAMTLRPDDEEPVAVLARIQDVKGDQAGAKSIMEAFAKAPPAARRSRPR
jgi:hypothetical protein